MENLTLTGEADSTSEPPDNSRPRSSGLRLAGRETPACSPSDRPPTGRQSTAAARRLKQPPVGRIAMWRRDVKADVRESGDGGTHHAKADDDERAPRRCALAAAVEQRQQKQQGDQAARNDDGGDRLERTAEMLQE